MATTEKSESKEKKISKPKLEWNRATVDNMFGNTKHTTTTVAPDGTVVDWSQCENKGRLMTREELAGWAQVEQLSIEKKEKKISTPTPAPVPATSSGADVDYFEKRLAAVEQLRCDGVNPYPHTFVREMTVPKFCEKFSEMKPETTDLSTTTTLAGRIASVRNSSNKLIFYTLVGDGMKIQLLCDLRHADRGQDKENKDQDKKYDDNWKMHKNIKMGDQVGVSGFPGRTARGELSLYVRKITLLTPCLRLMPTTHFGLADQDDRYRRRHLDLLVNEHSRDIFIMRARVIKYIRNFFDNLGFLEVETPQMATLQGGATARPFETFHNDLGIPMFMRVAPELYLKRLIVGGYSAVYEIGKQFRNEGCDTSHNAEFTSAEAYIAYKDYEYLMEMTERLLCGLVTAEKKKPQLDIAAPDGKITTVDFIAPFRRIVFMDGIQAGISERARSYANSDSNNSSSSGAIEKNDDGNSGSSSSSSSGTVEKNDDKKEEKKNDDKKEEKKNDNKERKESKVANLDNFLLPPATELATPEANAKISYIMTALGIACSEPRTTARMLDKLASEFIEPFCDQPTFVTCHPQIMSPLAKCHRDTVNFAGCTERFELFVCKKELVNAFTELNDSQFQRKCFLNQAKEAVSGDVVDHEAMPHDEDYCEALDYAMPPTAGWGMGIDRLVMFINGVQNIKEVILFPTLRPKAKFIPLS